MESVTADVKTVLGEMKLLEDENNDLRQQNDELRDRLKPSSSVPMESGFPADTAQLFDPIDTVGDNVPGNQFLHADDIRPSTPPKARIYHKPRLIRMPDC